MDDEEYEEIVEDMNLECGKFGKFFLYVECFVYSSTSLSIPSKCFRAEFALQKLVSFCICHEEWCTLQIVEVLSLELILINWSWIPLVRHMVYPYWSA